LIFKIFLTILPLILFVLLTNYDVFAQESELTCPRGEVIVVRTTDPNPICIDNATAHRWVQLKIAEILSVSIKEEPITEFEYESITDDLSRAQSNLVTISGGEITKPIVFQTFSQPEPSNKSRYIPSFYDLGLARIHS